MGRQRWTTRDAGFEADEALATLDADALRSVLGEVLDIVDDKTRAYIAGRLSGATAATGTWAPSAPSDEEVAHIIARVRELDRVGYADPSEVDALLQRGSDAFLCREYSAAIRIFRALFAPIGSGDINLGQDETVGEVLGVDTSECAAQHVVAVYMTTAPSERADAVRAAIAEADGIGTLLSPLRDMEGAAVEPLPSLDAFLPAWIALLTERIACQPPSSWESEQERWRREAVARLEGSAGLERVALETSRPSDLQAWCDALVAARDWTGALAAFEEATARTPADSYHRGRFLDGAALAAQELGHADLPDRLEAAWRCGPDLARMLRWVCATEDPDALGVRVGAALAACPADDQRQRGVLHLLAGDLASAASLLAGAAGLGWSRSNHPARILFPVFAALLRGAKLELDAAADPRLALASYMVDDDDPVLATPRLEDVIACAVADMIVDEPTRALVTGAMRAAAMKRVAGVTEKKRRRHYGHAADLVAACLACDPSDAARRWASELRSRYSRYPALRAELDQRISAA